MEYSCKQNPNLEVGGEGEAEGSDIWHFRRMKDGTYTIQSLFDGKYLDVEKFSDQKELTYIAMIIQVIVIRDGI